MPAGISWPRYLSVLAGAFLSMFAGAQTVHHLYQPLKDLEEAKVELEKAKVELEKEYLSTTNMNTAKVATS